MKEYDKAFAEYQQAMKVDEKLSEAWMGAGIVKDEMGLTREGLQFMEKAIDLEDINPEYWYILGDTYLKDGNLEKAKHAYRKVTELDPYNKDIWLDYADIFIQENKIDEAISILDKGIDSNPRNASNIYRRALYLLKKGYTKEAYSTIEGALILDYSNHTELFEYMPQLKNDLKVTSMIDSFRVENYK